MSDQPSDAFCECAVADFVSHGGWFRCSHCRGWLPRFVHPIDAVESMRARIEEGRATVARKSATP